MKTLIVIALFLAFLYIDFKCVEFLWNFYNGERK